MSNQQSYEHTSSIKDEIKEITLSEFVECRARELDAMMQSLSGNVSGGNRTPMQLLPRHMRRRAANHDVRRLPLSKRLAAKKELDSRPVSKRKPPSRRHRRRPANLLEEYARRKRKHVWLETHIWHAKRFHMTERWGYRLPDYPNDRGVRAVYRDSLRRCVLLDMSYLCCIELCGSQSSIVESLARLTSPETGPSVGAKCNLSGGREGRTVFYRADCYPFSAIGEVTFMWRCSSHGDTADDLSESRTLWIWVHPSCHHDIFVELKSVFHLTDNDCQTLPVVTSLQGSKDVGIDHKACSSSLKRKMPAFDLNSDEKRMKSEDESESHAVDCWKDHSAANAILDTKTIKSQNTVVDSEDASVSLFDEVSSAAIDETSNQSQVSCIKTPAKASKGQKVKISKTDLSNVACPVISKMSLTRQVYDNGKVRLESLKDDLCRFRLIGSTSHSVVVEALDFIKTESLMNSSAASDECDGASFTKPLWWKDYYQNDVRYSELQGQMEYWKTAVRRLSATDFPLHSILSLVVRDPRLSLPSKRTLAKEDNSAMMSEESDCQIGLMQQQSASVSPIWDRAVRDAVKLSKQTTAELNDIRSLNLVPGTTPDLGDRESRIPIMLVQRSSVTGSLMVSKQRDVGFGSGWDVILPTNWAMPFWIAFIYRGAKAAGLRDLHSLAMESGALAFPDSCPDTVAALEASKSLAGDLRASYYRKPPAKRCNYMKMGILSPFQCPWPQVVQGWSNDDLLRTANNSSVLCFRNRKLLRRLAESFATSNFTQCDQKSKVETSCSLQQLLSLDSFPNLKLSIVQVTVMISGRGVPSRYSLICLPTASDLVNLFGNNKSRRPCAASARSELCEPIHKTEPKSSLPETLPIDADVVGLSSRRTFGFVVEGGFSHSLGRGFGVGFVTLPGFLQLLNENRLSKWKSLSVLVRPTASLHYHAAELSLIV